MLDRRRLLLTAAGTLAAPAVVAADAPALRGTIDAAVNAGTLGIRAGALDDQTASLQRLIDGAARSGRALFLPPGRYVVSGLRLPSNAHIVGLPGQTRLVGRGGTHLLVAENAERLSLTNVVLDGEHRPLGNNARALFHAANCRDVLVSGIEVRQSSGSGIVLERCAGRIERSTISSAADAGVHALDSGGLALDGNTVGDCGNAGIRVWRSAAGDDGTTVSGNTVGRIRSDGGGNGQNGNGVNVYRAGGVAITGNRVADCAFSAIRNNAGADCRIVGNEARRSGEVAIFVEFGFLAAVVQGNLVDGAAAGISVTNFDRGGRLAAVQGNVVRAIAAASLVNPDTRPYGIAAEADAALTGNVVEDSAGVGLQLGWGPYLRDVAATGNVVRRAAVGIAVSVAPGAGRAVISDNVIAGARRGAILGMRWAEVATADLGREPAGAPANLTLARNAVS